SSLMLRLLPFFTLFPYTTLFRSIIMVFGSAALAGFPFFSGFYSKDYILEFTYSINCITSYLGFALGSVSAFFTAFYSFRLIYLRSEEHTSELQSRENLVCRLLLE